MIVKFFFYLQPNDKIGHFDNLMKVRLLICFKREMKRHLYFCIYFSSKSDRSTFYYFKKLIVASKLTHYSSYQAGQHQIYNTITLAPHFLLSNMGQYPQHQIVYEVLLLTSNCDIYQKNRKL